MPGPPAPNVTGPSRRVAALAHLGIPLWGPILPLVIHVTAHDPFRQGHARQALAYQGVFFLAVYLPLVVLAILLTVLPFATVPLALAAGFVLELPQVARALAGHRPFRIIPIRGPNHGKDLTG